MNIFILHHNHTICAKYHCDKHIVKMIIETAQLLYTCILISGIIGHDHSIINTAPLNSSGNHGYRPTHKNHPCSIWLRESIANYEWLCNLGIELCKQYTLRYGKIHATQLHIEWLCCVCPNIPDRNMTTFAVVMPDDCKIYKNNMIDPIESYRKYYVKYKIFAKWSNVPTPSWYC